MNSEFIGGLTINGKPVSKGPIGNESEASELHHQTPDPDSPRAQDLRWPVYWNRTKTDKKRQGTGKSYMGSYRVDWKSPLQQFSIDASTLGASKRGNDTQKKPCQKTHPKKHMPNGSGFLFALSHYGWRPCHTAPPFRALVSDSISLPTNIVVSTLVSKLAGLGNKGIGPLKGNHQLDGL